MKIRLVGAKLFHTDGRTDRSKLILAFSQFCEHAQKLDSRHIWTNKFKNGTSSVGSIACGLI